MTCRSGPPGDDRAAHPPAATAHADRRLVLRGPLRSRRGPRDRRQGMVVPPHPHTGLQTVSWLFSGEIEHRDSAGHHAFVRPGELNLMTAGRGISHSEYSTPGTTTLHGAQLWLALPDGSRQVDPGFEHYAPDPVRGEGWEARVFLGSLLGSSRRSRPTARCWAPSSSSSRYDAAPGRRPGVRAGDAGRHRRRPRGRQAPGRARPRLPRAGGGVTRPRDRVRGAAARARWAAVRRADRHVVELHRPRPRRGRGVPRRSGSACWRPAPTRRFALPADDPHDALHAPALPHARMLQRGP